MVSRNRNITKTVRDALKARCGSKCECCCLDIKLDKHHILEFSKGGPNSLDNLLALCQNCHKQIPSFLSLDQQLFLQKVKMDNKEISHSMYSPTNKFIIGGDLYEDVPVVLKIGARNIITIVEKDARYYANIVMLEHFSLPLLVFMNRVILGDRCEIMSKGNNLTVKGINGEIIYALEQNNPGDIPRISLSFRYKENVFIFGKFESDLNGYKHTGNSFVLLESAIYIED